MSNLTKSYSKDENLNLNLNFNLDYDYDYQSQSPSQSQSDHSNHQRHLSNVSSIDSMESPLVTLNHSSNQNLQNLQNQNLQNLQLSNNLTFSSSFVDKINSNPSTNLVSISNLTYPPSSNHHRSSSTSSTSSSPFTEITSISLQNSPQTSFNQLNFHTGRQTNQSNLIKKARNHANPYIIPNILSPLNNNLNQSKNSSNSILEKSIKLTNQSNLINQNLSSKSISSHSNQNSISISNSNSFTNSNSNSNSFTNSLNNHSWDPYPILSNLNHHNPTIISSSKSSSSLNHNNNNNDIINNKSILVGMGSQLGQMSLDSTKTYQTLAHHIRNAITTSTSDRARQAFVQAWLNSSYISYTNGNVSRQGLYGSYLRICQEYDIKPINSASFGKAVRQSYPNIKTRRLGVRGNSKYHYCGIRPATVKEAEILMSLSQNEQSEPPQGPNHSLTDDEIDSDSSSSHQISTQSHSTDDNQDEILTFNNNTSHPQTPKIAQQSISSLVISSSQNSWINHNPQSGLDLLLPFPNLEETLNQTFTHDLDHQIAKTFWKIYVKHSHDLLEYVKNNRFDQFELNLRTFWTTLDSSTRECVIHPVMMSLVYRGDAIIYDEILDYLYSQTLNQMSHQAFGSLRQLAQSMEQIIIVALENYPNTFVGPKIELAARFGHLIIRNLGICQLAQALSGVFSNPNNLNDMAEAWDGIDFEAVRNQAALVTNCQHDILGACFEDFRQVLNTPNATLDHFITFVESTYERCLQPLTDGERGLSPRSLLVRWCFVSSQLIRDLTLRSVSSFGSFQIVNLFFDEWLGFKVLRKVALHVAAVTASVDPSESGQVNPNSQPQQQLQLENLLFSSVENLNELSNIHNFSNQTLDPSHQLDSQSNNPHNSLMPTTLSNYSTSTNIGTEPLLFSPDHPQGLVIVQQQTDSANLENLSSQQNQTRRNLVENPSKTESLLSSSNTPLVNQQSLNDSSNHTPQSINSQSTTDVLNSLNFSNDNSIPLKSKVVYDQTFNELMDLSGFSITMNPSSNQPKNINLDLEQTFNGGLNDSVAGSLCTSHKL